MNWGAAMKINEVDSSTTNSFLKITDLENMFDVAEDGRGNYVFNFNKGLYIKVDKKKLPKFICDHAMHWTIISYRIYGTTRLAWLLWKLNDISLDNVFKAKQPGDEVLYLPTKYSDAIIADINEFDN